MKRRRGPGLLTPPAHEEDEGGDEEGGEKEVGVPDREWEGVGCLHLSGGVWRGALTA